MNPHLIRSKRIALPLSYGGIWSAATGRRFLSSLTSNLCRKAATSRRTPKLEHRTGVEPMSRRRQRRVLNQLDQRCVLVGEDRIELSPRVPRTRMLALHHTPSHPLTQTTCLISATTSTKSSWFFIDAVTLWFSRFDSKPGASGET